RNSLFMSRTAIEQDRSSPPYHATTRTAKRDTAGDTRIIARSAWFCDNQQDPTATNIFDPMAITRARAAIGRLFYQRCFYLFLVVLALIVGVPFIEPTPLGRFAVNIM